MKYYFIVNPAAKTGKGIGLWDEIKDRLDSSKIDYEAFFTTGAGSAASIARDICRDHPEAKRIVIVGGDGTFNEAVNGLSDYSRITLGLIPAGSGNDLARGLKIPTDPIRALQHVIHPREFKKVDHGLVEFLDGEGGSRRFAVSSGIGYDADICYQAGRSPLKKILNRFGLGSSIYYITGLKLIFMNRRAKTTVLLDGKRKLKCDRTVFITAMNMLYEGGGYPMAPGADPSDGKLSLLMVDGITRLKHCLLMLKVRKGEHIRFSGVDEYTGRTCEIEADRPLIVHTDGEFAGKHSHIRYSILPEQIRMMV
ncbi:MAG: diacylglycerol kinase family lipid kinase [Lachnospiraceae bacterium]|nr:diacylglycerol kinase family lipid kinase [Lachnospiraceae bacterium]